MTSICSSTVLVTCGMWTMMAPINSRWHTQYHGRGCNITCTIWSAGCSHWGLSGWLVLLVANRISHSIDKVAMSRRAAYSLVCTAVPYRLAARVTQHWHQWSFGSPRASTLAPITSISISPTLFLKARPSILQFVHVISTRSKFFKVQGCQLVKSQTLKYTNSQISNTINVLLDLV